MPPSQRYLVEVKSGADDATLNGILRKHGVAKGKAFRHCFNGFVAHLSDIQKERLLAQHGEQILSIGRDIEIKTCGETIDWGVKLLKQPMADASIQKETYATSNVRVYVVDTGAYAGHADLKHIKQMYDCTGADTAAILKSPADGNGHGTHVSGIISAKGNNTDGTVGMAPSVQLVAMKVLDSSGSGKISDVVDALNTIYKHRLDNPSLPFVVNMSIGGLLPPTDPIREQMLAVLAKCNSKGIVLVAAAGNAGKDILLDSGGETWPAASPDVISVAATTKDSPPTLCSFSNYGATCVIAAPGDSILSSGIRGRTSTALMSGTSMACPHVTGLVAMYLANAGTPLTKVDIMPYLLNKSVGTLTKNDTTMCVPCYSKFTPTTTTMTTIETPALIPKGSVFLLHKGRIAKVTLVVTTFVLGAIAKRRWNRTTPAWYFIS